MGRVAMRPDNLYEDIKRIIERRHPHLLPVNDNELCSLSDSSARPSLPSKTDRAAVEAMWKQGCVVLLLAGAAEDLVCWAAERTVKSARRILVVLSDDRKTMLNAMFHLYNVGLLDRPGLFWVETERMQEQLNQVFERNSLFLFKPSAISCHFASGTAATRRSEWERGITDFSKNYLAEREAHNERFALLKTDPPANLRVWSYALSGGGMYVHGPMLTALGDGFRETGAEVEIFSVERDDPAISYRLLDSLTRYRPSVFLSLNKRPSEAYHYFLDAKAAESLPQHRLIWLVDHPRFSTDEPFDERDWVWACDGSYADAAKQMGARRVFVAPPGADLPRDGTVRDKFRCKILFVGIYHDTSSFLNAMAPRTREHIGCLIQEMLAGRDVITSDAAVEPIPAEDLEQSRPAFEEFCRRLNKDLPNDQTKLLFVASVTASSRKRAEAVRALLPFGVHVYGNEAWSSVLRGQTGEVFQGIASRSDLPDIFASADIVLNCHSPQLPCGLNVRDFNVLRAGGCLLSDWVPNMDSGILEPGRDLECFRTVEDLIEQVEVLLNREDRRNALAESGYRTVMNAHLYRHRAAWLLSWLRC